MKREIKFRIWNDADETMGKPFYFNKPTSINMNSIIMQFTGLKDKNGKDIYEGDILKYSSDGLHFDKGDVIFSDGCFRCRQTFFHQLSKTITQLFEVIGNIYENPEPLTLPSNG